MTLLPCPFCGHKGVGMREGTTFRWRIIQCLGCGATCGEVRADTLEKDREKREEDAYAKAVEEWNVRAE